MRLTVAGETPSSAAIALPVQRCRRRSPTRAITAAGAGLRRRCGRDERSSSPASPSARQRATHLRTVLTQSPKAVATAFGSALAPQRDAPVRLDYEASGGLLMDVHSVLQGI